MSVGWSVQQSCQRARGFRINRYWVGVGGGGWLWVVGSGVGLRVGVGVDGRRRYSVYKHF